MDSLRVNTTVFEYLYHLPFSHYPPYISQLNPESIILFGCVVCAVLVALIVCLSKRPQRPRKPSESLQALFTVILPTSVAWPRDYARLVDYFTSARSKTIAISMTSLIGAVCDGNIEVRSYTDLPELFSEKLVVYGWRVILALDSSWNLAVLRWVIGSYFSWTQVFFDPLVLQCYLRTQ